MNSRYDHRVSSAVFAMMVKRAVGNGLAAAAILRRTGTTIAVAGALAEDEVRPIAGVVTRRLKSKDLALRMLAGEMVAFSLDDREISFGIAGRRVFVVAVLAAATDASRDLASALRHDVEQVIRGLWADVTGAPPWARGSGGSSSGPAGLPVIEIGLTVRRERGKA
jgi:hypothetical protein